MTRIASRVCLVAVLAAAAPAAADGPDLRELVGRLKDANPDSRIWAVERLGEQGRRAKEAVPALLEVLREADATNKVRPAVFQALERIGLDESLLPGLLAGLRDRDAGYANAMPYVLAVAGEPAVDGLLQALKDPQAAVRMRAASAILLLREPPAGRVAPALARMLTDPERMVQMQAAAALGKLGPGAEPAVPALAKAVRNKNVGAAHALGKIGPAAKPAVPALRQALRDTTTSVWVNFHVESDVGKFERRQVALAERAAEALAQIGPDAAAAVPELTRALVRDVRLPVRAAAARALAAVAPDNPEVVRTLSQAVGQPQSAAIREALVEALARLGEPGAPALTRLLREGDVGTRKLAALALGNLREGAKDSAGVLILALGDDDAGVRAAAARALGEVGRWSATGSLEALEGAAKNDADSRVRAAAAEAVRKLRR
jgi:HEAT repeat protein